MLGGIFGPVDVRPVLVYPGWWVEQRVREVEVPVYNDKQVVRRLSSLPRQLEGATIDRVAAFVEEKCRDVAL